MTQYSSKVNSQSVIGTTGGAPFRFLFPKPRLTARHRPRHRFRGAFRVRVRLQSHRLRVWHISASAAGL